MRINRFIIIWMLMVTSVICMDKISPTLPDMVAKVNPAVVLIVAENEYGQKWSGSGVIVHERGLILTAKHVIGDADNITVIMSDGKKYKSVDEMVDPNNDVGIIRIAPLEDLLAVKFGDYVVAGEEVFIVGSPFGFHNSVALGVVAGKDRNISFFGTESMLQLDIAGNPGSSGCPVFNMERKIVGIVVGGKPTGNCLTLAVSVDVCEALFNKYVGVNK